MNAAGSGSMLLLEDVDAAFAKREAADSAKHLTFSGATLLTLLADPSPILVELCGLSRPGPSHGI